MRRGKACKSCLPVVLRLVLGLLIVRAQQQPLEGVQRRVVVVLRTYHRGDMVLPRPVWPRYGRPARTHLPMGRGWPRLEAALSLTCRWWGALEGDLVKASGRLFPTQVLDLLTAHAHSLVGAPQAACPCPPFEVCACAPLPGDAVSGARQIQID